jgi:hypothetical protein
MSVRHHLLTPSLSSCIAHGIDRNKGVNLSDLGRTPLAAGLDELVDPKGDEEAANNEDDTEDEDDTGLTSSPVAALGEVRNGVADNNGVADGRHFDVED